MPDGVDEVARTVFAVAHEEQALVLGAVLNAVLAGRTVADERWAPAEYM